MLNDPSSFLCGVTLHEMSKSWHHLPPPALGKTNVVAAGLFPECLETLPIAEQCCVPQQVEVAACGRWRHPSFLTGCLGAISLPLISAPFSSPSAALGTLTFAPALVGVLAASSLVLPHCFPLLHSPLLHLSLLPHINISGDKLLPPAHLFLCTNL